jgi:hypothetical protein
MTFAKAMVLGNTLNAVPVTPCSTISTLQALMGSGATVPGIDDVDRDLLADRLKHMAKEEAGLKARAKQAQTETASNNKRCRPDPLCWKTWLCGNAVVHEKDGKPFSAMMQEGSEQDGAYRGYYLIQLLVDKSRGKHEYFVWERSGRRKTVGTSEIGTVGPFPPLTSAAVLTHFHGRLFRMKMMQSTNSCTL